MPSVFTQMSELNLKWLRRTPTSRGGFNWFEALGSSTCEAPLPLLRGKTGKTYINLRKVEKDDIDALNVQSIKYSKSLLECPKITVLKLLLSTQKRSITRNGWNRRGRWGTVDTFLHFQPLLLYFKSKQAQNLSNNKATLYSQDHAKTWKQCLSENILQSI